MQVSMMKKIYASALHTVVYIEHTDLGSGESKALFAIQTGLLQASADKDLWNLILSKEWFRRVWVFQEFVLARRPWIQCGRDWLNGLNSIRI